MTVRSAWVCLTLLTALACGRHEESTAEHPHEGVEAHTAEAPDHLLRIAPEMLRDLRVTTSAVEARPGGDGVTALGEIRVNEERYAEVGSPISARVVDVRAGIGDTVDVGQPLVVLESVELGKALAAVIGARARVELTRQVLARKRGLAGVVPRREVEEAEAAAVAAAADLRAAAAGLRALGGENDDSAAEDAARLSLRAPVAGTVIERDVVRGQMVEPSRVLFRVADLSRLWLIAHAFERDAVRVEAGAPARVSLAALPGRAFSGTVALVGRRVDPGSRTVDVRVNLDNPDGLLRPGMSASAWLPFGEAASTTVAIPAAALQRVAEGWAVFLPRGQGVFEPRQVGRGRDLGGEVEILQGLTPGETVVVEGAFLLKAEAEKARGEGERHEH
ncbi:MAG: efflux RND transporter periplasmic adaptor subunit [Candidatus Binatia bacterium]